MAEPGQGEFPETTSQPEVYNPKEVKDTWFQGYMNGNRSFPQTNREGIVSLTTSAVLNDPPKIWEHFFFTEVSDDQIIKMGNAMAGFHKKVPHRHNAPEIRYSNKPVVSKDEGLVKRITSYVKGEGKYHIKPERFQDIWIGTTEEVGRVIHGYIENKHYSKNNVLDYPRIQQIQQFFSEQKYAPRVEQLRETMSLVAQAVEDEKGTKISDEYKKAVVHRDAVAQGRWLYEIRQHMADKVHTRYPDENLNWMFGKWQREE